MILHVIEKCVEEKTGNVAYVIRATPFAPPIEDEEDKEKRVDEYTLKTLKELYEFTCQMGRVDFGKGRVYGTFKLFLPYKDGEFDLYVVRKMASSTFMWCGQTLGEAGLVLKRCLRKA